MAVILTRKLQSMGLAIVMMTSDVFILMHKKKYIGTITEFQSKMRTIVL